MFFPLINNTFWLAIVARIELKRQIAIERQTNVRHINKKSDAPTTRRFDTYARGHKREEEAHQGLIDVVTASSSSLSSQDRHRLLLRLFLLLLLLLLLFQFLTPASLPPSFARRYLSIEHR